MTKHMFRVFVGKGKTNKSDLETRTEDWVASNNPWEEDTIDHKLIERNTKLDGSGETYYMLPIRFSKDDTKDNLQQKLTDKLKDKVSWYRVGYHSCPHDEENGGPCSWDDSTEWTAKDVTIPSGVPTFDFSE